VKPHCSSFLNIITEDTMRCYLTIILAVFCCLSALGSINEGPGGAASSNPKAMNDGVEESQPSGDNLPPDLVRIVSFLVFTESTCIATSQSRT
jgi:hypothetical protein